MRQHRRGRRAPRPGAAVTTRAGRRGVTLLNRMLIVRRAIFTLRRGTVTDRLEDQGGAFAAALRAAISDRGITLARLRSQLIDDGNPVSMATLSYCAPVIGSPKARNR